MVGISRIPHTYIPHPPIHISYPSVPLTEDLIQQDPSSKIHTSCTSPLLQVTLALSIFSYFLWSRYGRSEDPERQQLMEEIRARLADGSIDEDLAGTVGRGGAGALLLGAGGAAQQGPLRG